MRPKDLVPYPRTTHMVRRSKWPVMVVGTLCVGAVAALALPFFVTNCRPSPKTVSLSRVKLLTTAVLGYAADNDDRLPPDMHTGDPLLAKLVKYLNWSNADQVKETLMSNLDDHPRFRGNQRLARLKVGDVKDPDHTIMFFEPESWPSGQRAVGFVDGHAGMVKEQDVLRALVSHRGVIGTWFAPSNRPSPMDAD